MAPASDTEAVAALKRPEMAMRHRPYKWGFRCHLKLTKELAGSSPSVREFASNSYVTFNGIDALHDEWTAARGKHPGKLPIVAGKSTIPVPGKSASTTSPCSRSSAGWIRRRT